MSAPQEPPMPRAWRISYMPIGGEIAIEQPRAVSAKLDPLEALATLATAAAADNAGTLLVYLPAGSGTDYEIQRQAESWMASRPGEHGAPAEILFRSERLIWRRGRAVGFGGAEALPELLAAVAHFSFCEGELFSLECEAQRAAATLEADAGLTHSVRVRDLARQPHVDIMTRKAVAMRLAFVRIQAALEAPLAGLDGPARRIFAELALQANAVDRLKSLDDTIELVEDLYELANDRLSDFRYFNREFRIEVLILLVLAGELLVTTYKFLF